MMARQATQRAATVRLPDELQGTVPREVRLTGGGIVLTAIAVAMAIGALVSALLMSIAYERADRERQLRTREAVAVQAEVVDVTLTRGDHPQRIVTYRYEVDGRSYTDRTRFGQNERRDITRGDLVPVGYVPSNARASWMIGYEPEGFPVLLIPIVSIALLFGAAGIAWILRRQWILLSEGRAALARITAHKKVQHSQHRAYRVSYEFQTLSGATRTASHESTKTPPPVGTMLPIVYHRDNPHWTATYPLQLVRARRIRRRIP